MRELGVNPPAKTSIANNYCHLVNENEERGSAFYQITLVPVKD